MPTATASTNEPILAELPDGTILEFPAGTSDEVIDRVVRDNLRIPAPAAPEPQVSGAELARSAFLEPYNGEDVMGVIDAAGSVTTNVAGEIAGGVTGALSAPLVGVDKAIEYMDAVRDFVGTDPFTAAGKEKMKSLGGLIEATGMPQAFATAEKAMGDAAFNAAGGDSEGAAVAGAAAKSIPTALLEVLGLAGVLTIRGAKKVTGIPDTVVTRLEREGKTVDDLSTDEIKQIQNETKQRLADQEARKQAFAEVGIDRPTRAQITQEPTDFMEQQELAKFSTATRRTLDQQDAQLDQSIADRRDATGGRIQSDSTVVNTIVERSTALDDQISALYKRAREAAPDARNVRFESLSSTMRKLRGDELQIISALRTRLADFGIIDPKTYKPTGKISVEQAEEVRKFLNEQWKPENAYAVRELKESLDADVFRVAGDDVFKEARKAKADYEKGLEKAKVSKFDKRKTNLVRDLLENKIDPDAVADRAVFRKGSYRADDLRQLKNYLQQDDAGRIAWDDMRAEVIERVRDRSFNGRDGDRTLSYVQLEKQLNAIGDKKMEVLFSPEERQFFKRLLEVAKLRTPKRGTAIGRGPSAPAVTSILRRLGQKGSQVADYFEGLNFNASDMRAITLPGPEVIDVSPTSSAAAAAVGGTTGVSGSERRKLQRQRLSRGSR